MDINKFRIRPHPACILRRDKLKEAAIGRRGAREGRDDRLEQIAIVQKTVRELGSRVQLSHFASVKMGRLALFYRKCEEARHA